MEHTHSQEGGMRRRLLGSIPARTPDNSPVRHGLYDSRSADSTLNRAATQLGTYTTGSANDGSVLSGGCDNRSCSRCGRDISLLQAEIDEKISEAKQAIDAYMHQLSLLEQWVAKAFEDISQWFDKIKPLEEHLTCASVTSDVDDDIQQRNSALILAKLYADMARAMEGTNDHMATTEGPPKTPREALARNLITHGQKNNNQLLWLLHEATVNIAIMLLRGADTCDVRRSTEKPTSANLERQAQVYMNLLSIFCDDNLHAQKSGVTPDTTDISNSLGKLSINRDTAESNASVGVSAAQGDAVIFHQSLFNFLHYVTSHDTYYSRFQLASNQKLSVTSSNHEPPTRVLERFAKLTYDVILDAIEFEIYVAQDNQRILFYQQTKEDIAIEAVEAIFAKYGSVGDVFAGFLHNCKQSIISGFQRQAATIKTGCPCGEVVHIDVQQL